MTRRVKDFIHDYVATVGPRSEAPDKFHYWAAVAAVSGALRRRCYVDMDTFKWCANWFIIFVGPPGIVKKSTTCDTAMDLLREVEGIHFGADCVTWEGFVTEVATAQDSFASGSPDAGFMDQEYSVSNALTLAISEFGTFFDPKNLMHVNVMTDLWDGKERPWKKATKTQGSDNIIAPFVNLIACTTPRWMLINFKGQFEGWGFSARCIFVHAAHRERDVPYPDELWGKDFGKWRAPFIETLQHISQLEGPYALAKDAREFGRQWYHTNTRRIDAVNASPHSDSWTADFLGRKQVHMFKLALVLAASRRDERVITLEDLTEAASRLDQIEDELTHIFGKRVLAGKDVRLNWTVWRAIESALQRFGKIREGDIYGYTAQYMTYGRAKEFIENLTRANILTREINTTDGATVLKRGPGVMSDEIEGAVDE
jgi:hypothetical protein